MADLETRKLWFAGISVWVAGILLIVSGFRSLAWVGLLVSVSGAVDYLFIRSSIEGYIASEVYGEGGESLWDFRSFFLMVGGPLLTLYAVLFV
jgi:hypothetical protein